MATTDQLRKAQERTAPFMLNDFSLTHYRAVLTALGADHRGSKLALYRRLLEWPDRPTMFKALMPRRTVLRHNTAVLSFPGDPDLELHSM